MNKNEKKHTSNTNLATQPDDEEASQVESFMLGIFVVMVLLVTMQCFVASIKDLF